MHLFGGARILLSLSIIESNKTVSMRFFVSGSFGFCRRLKSGVVETLFIETCLEIAD
jgi:hypothetical protein